ncbi:MAG: Gfo/Idh/MocA family oxidoreductase [Pirellulaceae bacterium]|nr:Gfo/Idh/MocA family oxidoreductase [Pirellulaceae bacterium]
MFDLEQSVNHPLGRRLRMGLVGGGGSGFIGRVHVVAAQLDGRAELVAGALSSNPDRSRAAATSFGIESGRAYGSYSELLDGELALSEDQRIDFVAIATPNDTHFEIASAALQAGFDVVCDKPLTNRVDEAVQLAKLVEQSGRVFVLTHNYSGYPMVRQARAMLQAGELGAIQAIRVNYIQGFLCGLVPGTVSARGVWKSDPQRAGSGSLGDIGTHAYQLACFVNDGYPDCLSSNLRTYHSERPLEDYGHVLLRWGDETLGCITFSQITHGRLNDLTLEVDGSDASLSWRQEEPNQLLVRRFGQPTQIYDRNPNASYTLPQTREVCRLPAGHPEAFFEAFANIYRGAFSDMVASRCGECPSIPGSAYPSVLDGVRGVRFVETCLRSHENQGCWESL